MCFSTRATTENPLIDGLLMWFKTNDCCLLQFLDIPILPRANVILGDTLPPDAEKQKCRLISFWQSRFFSIPIYIISPEELGLLKSSKTQSNLGVSKLGSCPWDPWVKRSKLKTKASHRAFGVQTIPSAGATPAFRPIDDATPPIAWREVTLR